MKNLLNLKRIYDTNKKTGLIKCPVLFVKELLIKQLLYACEILIHF